MTRVQMLTNFPKVFKGTHLKHPLVTTYRGERVVLESLDPSKPMDVYADGERVGPMPATMEAVRRALTVRVP
jgi:diacylglycerol kinase (ATP)